MIEEITQDNKSFRTFCMEDQDYVMNIMASWMKTDWLEGAKAKKDIMEIIVMKEAKQFTYRQIFRIHFKYRHQVYDNNNGRHAPIYLERTWATKFCPGRNFA